MNLEANLWKNLEKFYQGPVFPIPPAYLENGDLDDHSITRYIEYLGCNGAKVFMTTAGTSQFNLMSENEVERFNLVVSDAVRKEKGVFIAGLKPNSLRDTKDSLDWMDRSLCDAVLLLYPDRFYGEDHVLQYFYDVADYSSIPVFIHASPISRGVQSPWEYSKNLVQHLSFHENIFGMKEEYSTIDKAYDNCQWFDTIFNIKEFAIIVAGGSQRRFTALRPTGVQTFLAGIGSLFPQIDIAYFNEITSRNMSKAIGIQNLLENEFFKVFMDIGWHKALRCGISLINDWYNYERSPFPYCTDKEVDDIEMIIEDTEQELAYGVFGIETDKAREL